MNTVRLTRSGNAPLVFVGEVLAERSGQHVKTKEQVRWFELRVYRTNAASIFAAEVAYRSCWQGEHNSHAAYAGAAEAVRDWLVEYDPQQVVRGYPPGAQFREKQERLLREITAQYDALVGEVLAAACEYAEGFARAPEDAQDEPYRLSDSEAVQSFVRAQLAEFPLTEEEACVLCDANNGSMLFPDTCWLGLDANILDTPAAELTRKWGCNAASVARRVGAADRGTQFALAWAVAQFWRRTDLDTREALESAGFAIKCARAASVE